MVTFGNSLAVQWLRLCASNVGGSGSIPGWRTKMLQACGKAKKKQWNGDFLLCVMRCHSHHVLSLFSNLQWTLKRLLLEATKPINLCFTVHLPLTSWERVCNAHSLWWYSLHHPHHHWGQSTRSCSIFRHLGTPKQYLDPSAIWING